MATTTITVTYPNGQGQNLLDYFATQHSYQTLVSDPTFVPDPGIPIQQAPMVPNPESKLQFFDRKVKDFIRDSVRAGKATADAKAARDAAIASIDSTIPIT